MHYPVLLRIKVDGVSNISNYISAHRSMWSVTNYFLVNLTMSDILLATLNCIFSFVFMRDRTWVFGPVFCVVNNFISYVTVAANVFTLLAVTCDRRRAILFPLRVSQTISVNIQQLRQASILVSIC